jgi:membrane associated rhomboid family serine protease
VFPLRDENRSPLFPFVTVGLILVNVLVFAYQVSLGPRGEEEFVLRMGAIPHDLLYGVQLPYSTQPVSYWTLLSCLFVHAGIWHLVGNMWFLWIFGDNIEAFLGRFRFLFFYLICGVLASLSHVFCNPGSTVPIVGVLGAYSLLYPRVRIRTLVILGFFIDIIPIPAFFFLGFWFFLQFLGGLGAGTSDVAFAAHIGGFLAGIAILLLVSRRSPRYWAIYRTAPSRLPRWHRDPSGYEPPNRGPIG